jgi:uncharacterized membrane protein YfcA
MFWIIPTVAFFASLLTFFSGFGLGTILLASMLWFYPPEVAIALTAMVHLLNSAVKSILNRRVNWGIVLSFGIPSVLCSILGSMLLSILALKPLIIFDLTHGNLTHPVQLLSIIVGGLMMIFAVIEFTMKKTEVSFPMWLGGVFSGFFGGLSGHQGALRSMFLIKRMKEIKEFVATTAFISLATDIARNSVYWTTLNWRLVDFTQLLIVSMGSILGVFLGTYLLKKITLHLIQYLVAVGLFFLGLSITIGLI